MIILKYGWLLVEDWGVCYGKKLALQITKILANFYANAYNIE